MSALGNKMFAAPEIINQVRSEFRPRTEPSLKKGGDQGASTTETISNYVADYGLLVDSYSMGHSIRYMMTGVQPGISVEDAIRQQNGGCIGELFSLCLANKNKSNQKRTVRYRSMDDLPSETCRLVGALTQILEKNRMSIRKARWSFPWIADVLEPQEEEKVERAPSFPQESEEFYRISHLPFATGKSIKTPNSKARRSTTATVPMDASSKTIDDTLDSSPLSF